MLKRFPLFPFFLVLYIILNLVVTNQGEIPAAQAWPSLGVLLACTAAAILVLYALGRDWHYAAYVAFLMLVFFFVFAHLSHVLERWLPARPLISGIALTIWGAFLIFLGWRRRWQRWGGEKNVTPILNLILALALASQSVLGLVNWFRGKPKLDTVSESVYLPALVEIQPKLDCSSRPDIYYIILDGYGRADVLEAMYGVDTRGFLDFLRQQGFYVADQSHTNYTQTVFSVPAGLNFTYLESEPETVSGLDYFSDIFAKNRLMAWLKGCNYKTIAFETGFYFTNHPDVDVYLSEAEPLDEFTGLLLAGSPLDVVDDMLFAKPVMNDYEAHRARVRFDFKQLKALPSMPGPKMVFVHVISPHPPFVFDANGQPIEPAADYKIADGDDYTGDWQDYRQNYAGQVEFVNQQVQEVVSAILGKSAQPPIIILQGDHGPGGWLDWDSPDNSCLWERTGILNAYYLPGGRTDRLYPQISPVNSFRVILDTYFGADLGLLPDRTYFTSHRLIRQVLDITEARESKNNCPSPR